MSEYESSGIFLTALTVRTNFDSFLLFKRSEGVECEQLGESPLFHEDTDENFCQRRLVHVGLAGFFYFGTGNSRLSHVYTGESGKPSHYRGLYELRRTTSIGA
jgi:hypothetical protein